MVKYRIGLTESEREDLKELLAKGRHATRKLTRARILRLSDEDKTAEEIGAALSISPSAVERTRRRCAEGGVPAALVDRPRPGAKLKLDERQQARLIAEACSKPGDDRARWTLKLLAGRGVELGLADTISPETVRSYLKNDLKPWQKQEGCIPEVSGDYVAAMEGVLDVYAEPYDPQRPVVGFDETPRQLIGEVRTPPPVQPDQPAREDTEYIRHGVAEVLLFCEPAVGRREAWVTEHRTKIDFAQAMERLTLAYPQAEVIRVVLDNLNTHKPGSLYEAFPPEKANAILKKLEFHHTPKHGSWLNMAEIEFSALSRQCLDQRTPDIETLKKRVDAWITTRNHDQTRIHWQFTSCQARKTMAHCYPAQSTG